MRRLLPALLLFIAGLAAGMLAARGGVRILPEPGLDLLQAATVFLLAPLLFLLAVAAHEAGHVLGGRLAGFRLILFVVGPFRLERRAHGFRAGWNRSLSLAGGLAAMTPVGLHDLRARTLLLVAGGPIASLMIGSQLLAIYHAASGWLSRDGAPFTAVLAGIALLVTGGLCILIGAVTLVPARAGGFYSDGARMLRLMRVTDQTEREVALITLTAISLGGARPAEWDPALVSRGAGIRDGGPFQVLGRQFAHAHALDRGDVDAARHHLEAALDDVDMLPTGVRASLFLAAATFAALYDGDADRARRLMDRARHGLLSAPHQRRLAEAACLLASGEIAAARTAARDARRLASDALDRGGAALDVALADEVLRRAG